MDEFQKILKVLSKKDPVLGVVIRQAKLQAAVPRKNHFQSLVASVISQQLSTKAADTIEQRFVDIFGGKFPKPHQILRKTDVQLRKAGLSGSKVTYIKNIAEAVTSGSIKFKQLLKADDETVIAELTKIKGIGRWTAEMFLMFSLGRPDIFSHGDLGLKNAIKKLYKIDPTVHTKKYHKLIESWKPHRSIASRYLWKSLDSE